MKCGKCGLDLPAGAKQCPKCGTINEFIAPPPASKKMKPAVYIIIALAGIAILALVAAVIAGRGNQNVTSAPGPAPAPPGNVTSAPAGLPSGGQITSAPSGVPAPPQTGPATPAKPKPPQSVIDYLEYVKGVEEHRQMLLKDTTDALTMAAASGAAQNLMDLIDMAMDPDGAKARDPLAETKKELTRQYINWFNTLKYLDKKPAPPECREFAGAYRDVLYRETDAIGRITAGMKNVDFTDPKDMSKMLKALQGMKADPSIQANIDKSADNADGKLNALVAQYDMEKPFDVPREQQTSGNITGF